MINTERYAELFGLEMYAWCKGLEGYPGEMYPELMRAIISDLKESFHEAVRHKYACNLPQLADSFAEVTKFRVHPKEITFYMLAMLPNPSDVNEEELLVLLDIVDTAEQKYHGALERIEKKWSIENKQKEKDTYILATKNSNESIAKEKRAA